MQVSVSVIAAPGAIQGAVSFEAECERMAQGKGGGQKPITLSAEQIAQVSALAQCGMSVELIADYLGVGRTTFYAIQQRQPEVAEQFARARAQMVANVAKGWIARAVEGDNTCADKVLSVFGGWRAPVAVEHTGRDGGPMQHEHTLSDEAAANLDAIASRLAGSAGAAGVAGKGEA